MSEDGSKTCDKAQAGRYDDSNVKVVSVLSGPYDL